MLYPSVRYIEAEINILFYAEFVVKEVRNK